MKTQKLKYSLLLLAAVTVLAFAARNVAAQDSTAAPAAAGQPAPQLSYGVPSVLQLVQAKVSDSIIVNYIQNSGTIYALKADEIVYLKQQGASDAVLNAMLTQRVRLTGSTEPATTTAAPPAPSAPPPAPSAPADTTGSSSAYVQSAPPSTVYVIPDTQTYYYDNAYYGGYPYYYGYPYYGGYYGWPGVSLSFGWGGWGGYYGGWHGGGYGGWHGGGGGFHGGGGGGGWHGGGGGFRR